MTQTLSDPQLSPIQKFYAGSSVFITGGTGFLGTILIEKLLRSCSEIETIYLLARSKKGKDVQSRVDELLDNIIFERLKREVPKFRHKIVAVSGDCNLPDLGISDQDRQMLINEVTIIFHVAATVRFDEKLRNAVNINIRATEDMLTLAQKMPHLKSYIHVSTAFSYPMCKEFEEKFYAAPMEARKLYVLVDTFSEVVLDKMTPMILDQFPNTYTYTKAVAEDVVHQFSKKMPIGMFRPSIVISTFKEPVPAWINNLYGPTGVCAGAAGGILRALHTNYEVNANVIPVDMCVNAMIAQSWDVAEEFQKTKANFEAQICFYESSRDKPITWGEFMHLAQLYGFKTPSSKIIWYYIFGLYSNIYAYKFAIFFLHYIPAILVDMALFCINKPPKMLRIYKKIHKFTDVISYFSLRNWTFHSVHLKKMIGRMDEKDRTIFFCDLRQLDWHEYFSSYIKGIREYLLQDPEETIPEARKRYKKLYILHCVVRIFVAFFVFKLFWWICSLFF